VKAKPKIRSHAIAVLADKDLDRDCSIMNELEFETPSFQNHLIIEKMTMEHSNLKS
jgi:hypothetical protein